MLKCNSETTKAKKNFQLMQTKKKKVSMVTGMCYYSSVCIHYVYRYGF